MPYADVKHRDEPSKSPCLICECKILWIFVAEQSFIAPLCQNREANHPFELFASAMQAAGRVRTVRRRPRTGCGVPTDTAKFIVPQCGGRRGSSG